MTDFAKSLTIPLALAGTLAGATAAFAQSAEPPAPAATNQVCTIHDNVLTLNVPHGDAAGSVITIDFGTGIDRAVSVNDETLILRDSASTRSAVLEQAYGAQVQQVSLSNKGVFDGFEDKYQFAIDLGMGQFLSIGLPTNGQIDHIEFTTTADGGYLDDSNAYEVIECEGPIGQLQL